MLKKILFKRIMHKMNLNQLLKIFIILEDKEMDAFLWKSLKSIISLLAFIFPRMRILKIFLNVFGMNNNNNNN